MTASRPRRSVEHLKPYQFKPGQSGNPRGSNHLQTFRARLAELDPVAMQAMKRVLESAEVDNNTWRFVLRLYVKLRYPEEWNAVLAIATAERQPLTINAIGPAMTPEQQQLRAAIMEFLAAKAKEAAHTESPALPNGGLGS